uniref:Cystatin domain-containing protein n=1 Tax=Pygocentrus nattereri TaxID=42514 RepID=A0AAR2IXZ6_PYGNA
KVLSGVAQPGTCSYIKNIEKQTGKQFAVFETLTFRTQIVAGKNYNIKVQIIS